MKLLSSSFINTSKLTQKNKTQEKDLDSPIIEGNSITLRIKGRAIITLSKNATWIDLSFKQLQTIPKGIKLFKNLQRLDLRDNQLTNLSGLPALPNLQTLYLENNQLTNLSGLLVFPNLQELDLENNQLTNLSGLSAFPNLQTLYLTNNQFKVNKVDNLNVFASSSAEEVTRSGYSCEQREKTVLDYILMAEPECIKEFTTGDIGDLVNEINNPNICSITDVMNNLKGKRVRVTDTTKHRTPKRLLRN